MAARSDLAELPALDGYLFIAAADSTKAHLSVSDGENLLTICRAPAAHPQAFAYLPHGIGVCADCLRIAEEASTRPV